MNDSTSVGPFHLSRGGLLYRLLLRMRLLDEDRYDVWRRIAIFVGLAWLPLVILSAIAGTLTSSKIGLPFFSDPGPYARFLFALPLLVAAGSIIDPFLASVVQHFWSSGLLPNEEQDRYKDALLQMRRRRDSLWVEIIMIAIAFLLALSHVHGNGDTSWEEGFASWMWVISDEGMHFSPAAWWYLLVSAPLFQFMFYRWFWRFLIWACFLYGVSRMRLALKPTHPDLVGGLGRLSFYQLVFGIILLPISAVLSSELAIDILFEGRTLKELLMEIIGFVILCVAVIVGPLFFFLGTLKKAKQRGLLEYGRLGYQLSEAFHAKYIFSASLEQEGEELMNTAHSSAIADFSATYDNVSSMRLVALNPRSTILLAVILLIPFLPLVLTEFSLSEVLERIGGILV